MFHVSALYKSTLPAPLLSCFSAVNRTEMCMIRWMCGVKLNERKKSEELKRTLRIGTSQFDDQKE